MLISNTIKWLNNTTDTTTTTDIAATTQVFHHMPYDCYLTLEFFFLSTSGYAIVQFYNEHVCICNQQVNASQAPTNRHTIWFPMKAGWSYTFISLKDVSDIHEVYRY